jgi:drug/metabolite transporter (DMT)-like permease
MKSLSPKTKGALAMIFSAFCFAGMNLAVSLAGDLPSIQKAIFRNSVAFLVSGFICLKKGAKFSGNKKNLLPLVGRATCGTLGIVCNFYAIDRLLLSDASMLNKMSPFFAVIFCALILKERPYARQILAVCGAFLGCLFVIKPSMNIFGNSGALVGLLGGFLAGLAYSLLRVCAKGGERGEFIVMFFSLFSTVTLLPLVIMGFQPMSLKQLILLITAGIFATGGQFGITRAYSLAPPKEIALFDYSIVIFAAIFGFIFFFQVPDIWSVLGYIIIFAMAALDSGFKLPGKFPWINLKSDKKNSDN